MDNTTKRLSERDANQTLQAAFNDINSTLGVDGFIVGKLGRKIVRAIISATIDDFSFYDSSTLLYTIRVTYDNTTHDNVNQVERTV